MRKENRGTVLNREKEYIVVDYGPLFSLSRDDGKGRFIHWEERSTERRCPFSFLKADNGSKHAEPWDLL
ncbi:MAG: hypothetical protein FWH55_13860 [Oscillospiraceae bacterium]|nr:hypothetical protein [Oscillospiraceae bacterium]